MKKGSMRMVMEKKVLLKDQSVLPSGIMTAEVAGEIAVVREEMTVDPAEMEEDEMVVVAAGETAAVVETDTGKKS